MDATVLGVIANKKFPKMSDDNEDLVSLQSFRRSMQLITTQGKNNPSYDYRKSRLCNSLDFGPPTHDTFIMRSCRLGTYPTAKASKSAFSTLRRSSTVESSHSIAALAPTKRNNDPVLHFAGDISLSHHKRIMRRSSTSGLEGHGGRRVRRSDKICRDPPADANSEWGELNARHPVQQRDRSNNFVEIDFKEKIGRLLSLDRPLDHEVMSVKTDRRPSLQRQNSLVSSSEVSFDKKTCSLSSINAPRRGKNYGETQSHDGEDSQLTFSAFSIL